MPAAFAIYPSLQGVSVIVTGGASGIGAEIVRAFAAQGARVAFVDFDVDRGTALASELGEAGGRVRFEPRLAIRGESAQWTVGRRLLNLDQPVRRVGSWVWPFHAARRRDRLAKHPIGVTHSLSCQLITLARSPSTAQ